MPVPIKKCKITYTHNHAYQCYKHPAFLVQKRLPDTDRFFFHNPRLFWLHRERRLGKPPVTRLIHKICTAASGNGIPAIRASTTSIISEKLSDNKYSVTFRILSNILRPSSTA